MFIDIPSKSSRRREKVPTISKRAIISEVQDVISQIYPRLLRERNILCFIWKRCMHLFIHCRAKSPFLIPSQQVRSLVRLNVTCQNQRKAKYWLFFTTTVVLLKIPASGFFADFVKRVVGHLTIWNGHYWLTDNTLKNITLDVLLIDSLILYRHNNMNWPDIFKIWSGNVR